MDHNRMIKLAYCATVTISIVLIIMSFLFFKAGSGSLKRSVALHEMSIKMNNKLDRISEEQGRRVMMELGQRRMKAYVKSVEDRTDMIELEKHFLISNTLKIYSEAYLYGCNDILHTILTGEIPKEGKTYDSENTQHN